MAAHRFKTPSPFGGGRRFHAPSTPPPASDPTASQNSIEPHGHGRRARRPAEHPQRTMRGLVPRSRRVLMVPLVAVAAVGIVSISLLLPSTKGTGSEGVSTNQVASTKSSAPKTTAPSDSMPNVIAPALPSTASSAHSPSPQVTSKNNPAPPAAADHLAALVNKEHPLEPLAYVPKNMKHVGQGEKLRTPAADSYQKMRAQAKKDGIDLHALSGYRSYDSQKATYSHWQYMHGAEYANTVSAKPGASEHQTGLSIDVGAGACDLRACFGDSKAGRWVAKNAPKYGFVVRYPKNKQNVTGYRYEPWHLRYVESDLARQLTAEKITLEEYYGKD